MTAPTLLLGGGDLEMATIARLGRRHLGEAGVRDLGLRWGARASAHFEAIRELLARGGRPVLVELRDDLPPEIDRSRLVFIDHHGERAGADRPSALRQVFELLGLPDAAWTRDFALVEANDVGHIAGLRALGASAAEIRTIRDADRAAQGVTPDDEAAARRALAQAERRGRLLVVRLDREATSPVGDFLEPEYGGPGAPDLLVLTPQGANFFGSGGVVTALAKAVPGSWFGGALPARGYWGAQGAVPADLAGYVAGLLGD